MFSKACEYGIRATIYIAMQSLQGNRVNLKEISKEIDSPVAFTAKILQQLAKNDIINSVKGPTGGFEINKKDIDSIKLIHIVSAIDSDKIFNGCGLGLKECNEDFPCPVHFQFKEIRDNLKKMSSETSIYELATGLEVGLTFLKR
ncbi:RrF2 family transcriptional regulator [Gillisia limnaea]|uniref:Transcriptional regulator, BadM/Rrf2 family n=1 Tax=Gillisia limnaea (strain DSM 15749 / LMG 21470 / R-8282) TaxID=865937 RepID=H2BTA5_GILLR|nr:Rrf2 family transcriptional regulator [Gillisia limnaea]EHQ03704.1 transcriptional regulator, BadM/Rrf2 family [Gillisia limnaea DSM 15749]